jgi:hypothetical protein
VQVLSANTAETRHVTYSDVLLERYVIDSKSGIDELRGGGLSKQEA